MIPVELREAAVGYAGATHVATDPEAGRFFLLSKDSRRRVRGFYGAGCDALETDASNHDAQLACVAIGVDCGLVHMKVDSHQAIPQRLRGYMRGIDVLVGSPECLRGKRTSAGIRAQSSLRFGQEKLERKFRPAPF